MLKKALKSGDFEEERRLQFLRQVESERRQRIFNAHERTIGIDVQALDQQSEERMVLRRHEEENERLWHQQAMLQQAALDEQAERVEQRRREIAADLQNYRSTYQLPEMRREFDLNDPQRLTRDRPNLATDTQNNLGVSSGQVFEGEDLGRAEREHRQREQQRAWLEQQEEMRTTAQRIREAERSRLYHELKCDETYGRCMERCIEYQRANNAMMVREFNEELAKKKEMERRLARQENEEDNRAEVINMLASDLLRDEPSKRPPLQRNPSNLYHGLTPEEQTAYEEGKLMEYREMKEQKNKSSEERTRAEELNFMHVYEQHKRYDDECERGRLAAMQQLTGENMELARQQREQRQSDEENSRNAITDEFYNKFNVTSR